ncbi:MAG: hypothetical protein HKM93_11305 [Desulfobacteraceae bacterium]|nr:hypothetical protein [Desulfobacteraceae bacterium]
MRKINFIYIGLILFCTMIGVFSTVSWAEDEIKAEALVKSYYSHLQNGNTSEILNMIIDPLLSERSSMLSNPLYANYLKNIYSGASASVRYIGDIYNTQCRVELTILRAGQSVPKSSVFTLKRVNDEYKLAQEIVK